jgi:hypothetical protein
MKFMAISLFALCLPVIAFCQDITGLWTGTLYNDSTQQFHDYEIGISKENGKYVAISKTCFLKDQKKYEAVKKVKVRIAADGKIVVEDGELVYNNYPVQAPKEVRQLNVLDLQKQDDQYLLSGIFVTNTTKKYLPLTGKISLKRSAGFSSTDLQHYLQKDQAAREMNTNTGAEPLVKNEKDK